MLKHSDNSPLIMAVLLVWSNLLLGAPSPQQQNLIFDEATSLSIKQMQSILPKRLTA